MHKTMLGGALIATGLCLAACSALFPQQDSEPVPIDESAVTQQKKPEQIKVEPIPVALPAEEIGYYMDIQEAKLRQLLGDRGVDVTRTGDRITLSMPGQISFAPNSFQINAAVEPLLASISGVLVEFDKTLVSVHGHTDDGGTEDYNQKLSEQRGKAVARYLCNDGVSNERLVVIGHGETRPAAPNDTDQGRLMNRRIELVLEPMRL